MFSPNTASLHQGTLVTQLLALTLLTTLALRAHRWLFVTLALVQAAWFLLVWLPAAPAETGTVHMLPLAVLLASGLALLWCIGRVLRPEQCADASRGSQ
jgi:hypothetical protein